MAGLNDSPECLAERLARLERKVKTLEERLDELPTMEDMKRVFATKQDFKTLSNGIGEAHYKLDTIIEHLGIDLPKRDERRSG